jgi:hypothetical protein
MFKNLVNFSYIPKYWIFGCDKGSILLFHLWQRKPRLSRLMVATQQVQKNHDIGALDKERLTVVLDF